MRMVCTNNSASPRSQGRKTIWNYAIRMCTKGPKEKPIQSDRAVASERQPDREDHVVGRGMKAGGRDLVSATKSKTESFSNVQPPDNQSRRNKVLLHPVLRALLEES